MELNNEEKEKMKELLKPLREKYTKEKLESVFNSLSKMSMDDMEELAEMCDELERRESTNQ